MRSFFVIFLLSISQIASAQKYWQQEVNYQINVALDDQKHTLVADETIEYINNSPFALNIIYFHIWPNAYKNNHTGYARQKVRDGNDEFYFTKDENRGWIENLDFQVNGEKVEWAEDEQHIDIVKITLNKPLGRGERISITTPFKVQLPHTFSRLGHIKQSYQITQWFPKPTVFDKEGWHPMPYLDQGEFYSEFGSFDVKITLPENYVVGATGVLQNEYEKQWMTDRVGQVFKDEQVIPSSPNTKTLHFVQDNIHDFAWFADKNYNVKKGKVTLPHSGRTVDTWYLYHSRFKESVIKAMIDLHDATYFYSKFIGDYPYSAVTAVTGPLGAGGGMEYPMITITDPSAIVHEVGHNWFYGILGTNERAFAWMDEGLNSFFENKTYEEQAKKDSAKVVIKYKNQFQKIASGEGQKVTSEFVETRNMNQPVHHYSNGYHSTNYFIQLYQKPVILMQYLQDYLGEEVFIECFLTYYDRWKFKHPYLSDMRAVFEEVSGKDLYWMFHTIIKNNITPNTRIKKVVRNKRGVDALFVSDYQIPVKVNVLDKDKNKIKSTWIEFEDNTTNAYLQGANKIEIDDENMVFKSSRGKFSRSGSILQKYKVPTLNKLAVRDNFSRANIAYTPVVGYNQTDDFLLGLAVYNTGIRSRRINYTIAPLYSTGSKDIRGLSTINTYFYPKKDFNVVELSSRLHRFQNYDRVGLQVSHWSKPTLVGVSWNQKIIGNFDRVYQDSTELNITHASYEFGHKDAVRKLLFKPTLGFNSMGNNVKFGAILTSVEMVASYEFMKKTRLKARFFAGIYSALQDSVDYHFGLSNGVDYSKNYYAMDRSPASSFMSNGLDGGFRGFENVYSNQIVSWNTSVGIPKIPFSLYYDGALVVNNFHWGIGSTLHIVDDFVEVYFPIAGTNFINGTPDDAKEFFNAIRLLLKIPLKSSNEIIWDKI